MDISADRLWKRYYRYRSEATQAAEVGDTSKAERLTTLAERSERLALRAEYNEKHYGVFPWNGAQILEPGDRGW